MNPKRKKPKCFHFALQPIPETEWDRPEILSPRDRAWLVHRHTHRPPDARAEPYRLTIQRIRRRLRDIAESRSQKRSTHRIFVRLYPRAERQSFSGFIPIISSVSPGAERESVRALLRSRQLLQAKRKAQRGAEIPKKSLGIRFHERKKQSLTRNHPPLGDDRQQYISVEIECTVPRSANIADQLATLPGWVTKRVTVKYDGSIRPPEEHVGREVVITAPHIEYPSVVSAVCQKLNEIGAKINSSCGLHIHLDCRDVPSPELLRRHNALVSQQQLMFALQPPSRRTNSFCAPSRRIREWTRPRSRYRAINRDAYGRHRTLEVRLHSGTGDAGKILAWSALLLALMHHQTELRPQRRISTLCKKLNLPKEIMDYLCIRFQRMNPSPADLESPGSTVRTLPEYGTTVEFAGVAAKKFIEMFGSRGTRQEVTTCAA